ncbi:glycosyltransferase family 2 protein [Turicibacter bilis]|uniref:Glycosyltransferase n=1 Tax=Turicibacter bilis TaxID=2735723 RepID=A0ABY5JKA4_9FIRM|nr:glycosyltransferase [Turicibacter bilis]MBS3200948.1 glycosyltransferase [Turicibacter bilis]UUF07124.1 glycosyltransferase [Turicibacter bilis]
MITIIIPVFNVGKYIRECLESLFCQTYSNFELIIVNDGSTDNSLKIIKEYINEYSEKITLLNQENQGVSEARNLANNYIRGDYLIYIDPDDYLHPDYLKKLVLTIEKEKSDVAICGYEIFYDDIKGENYQKKYNVSVDFLDGIATAQMMMNLDLEGYLWNKLFRVSALKAKGIFFEKGRYIQDWYPVFKTLASMSKITFINESLYFYRQRSTSTVYKKSKKKVDDYYYACRQIIKKAELLDIDSKIIAKFRVATFLAIATDIYYINDVDIIDLYQFSFENGYTELIDNVSILKNREISFKQKIKLLLWRGHAFYKIPIVIKHR